MVCLCYRTVEVKCMLVNGRAWSWQPTLSGPRRRAAEHLVDCARIGCDISDFERHDACIARLKEERGRKFGFRSLTAA